MRNRVSALSDSVGRFWLNREKVVSPDSQKLCQLRVGSAFGKVAHEPAVQALGILAMSIEVVLHGPRDAFWARSEEQQSGSLALLTLLALVALVRLALRGWANPFVFIRCNQSSGDANPLRAPRSFPCAQVSPCNRDTPGANGYLAMPPAVWPMRGQH